VKRFTQLIAELDRTDGPDGKAEALRAYFETAPPDDAAWAVYLLIGCRLRRAATGPRLRAWAMRAAGVPEWLFEASHNAVGDLAETVALLVPPAGAGAGETLAACLRDRVLPLRQLDAEQQCAAIVAAWGGLSTDERIIFNRLVTGTLHIRMARGIVARALAGMAGIPVDVVSRRLADFVQPTADAYHVLVDADTGREAGSRPFPFPAVKVLDGDPAALGARGAWHAAWSWEGIRVQLARRDADVLIWTEEGDFVTPWYPEIEPAARRLPDDTVLDGWIVPFADGAVLPRAELDRRSSYKLIHSKLLREVPVVVFVSDLLAHDGLDLRDEPFARRRGMLTDLMQGAGADVCAVLRLSESLDAPSWDDVAAARASARSAGATGVELRRMDAPYRADTWSWPAVPFTTDAVLLYVRRSDGMSEGPFAEFTFAVWNAGELVPIARTPATLGESDMLEVDRFVRANTCERFGPVRSVVPWLVFELEFDGISRSARRKSGVAVRRPRIVRWRRDARPEAAASLAEIGRMIDAAEASARRKA